MDLEAVPHPSDIFTKRLHIRAHALEISLSGVKSCFPSIPNLQRSINSRHCLSNVISKRYNMFDQVWTRIIPCYTLLLQARYYTKPQRLYKDISDIIQSPKRLYQVPKHYTKTSNTTPFQKTIQENNQANNN